MTTETLTITLRRNVKLHLDTKCAGRRARVEVAASREVNSMPLGIERYTYMTEQRAMVMSDLAVSLTVAQARDLCDRCATDVSAVYFTNR